MIIEIKPLSTQIPFVVIYVHKGHICKFVCKLSIFIYTGYTDRKMNNIFFLFSIVLSPHHNVIAKRHRSDTKFGLRQCR